MRRFFSLFLCVIALCSPLHALEDGQTVRLVCNGLTLSTQDSKLDVNANAVLWTETGTNAQRWRLKDTGRNSFYLVNAYSGYYLGGLTSTAANAQVGQVAQSTARTRGMWELEPVEGTTDSYILYLGTARRMALGAPESKADGGKVLLLNAQTADEERIHWTVEPQEPLPNELTEAMRDDMMNKWRNHYYHKAGTGYIIGRGGWWGDAEMFEVVLDALETTGEAQYATMFDNLYKNFCQRNNTDWSGNEYNDDIAWMCIACVRAYLLTGNTEYRTRAKQNFDKMYARAQKHDGGTLLWRQSSPDGTNSCVNGPAAVCACYLAEATGQESYYEKAASIYAGERSILYNIKSGTFNGQVYDSYNMKERKVSNTWSSTYNQGTCLGAAIMLWNHYGKAQYRNDADAIMKWTADNLADSHDIVKVCQTVTGDLTGFKGILMRYVRRYAADLDHPEYYTWLARNAYHAWNNRNSKGISMSAWLHKTTEDFNYSDGGSFNTDGVGAFTAVSAAFNAHLGVLNHRNAYERMEAEQFSYLQGTPVNAQTDDDGTRVAGPMQNQQYLGYRRVSFPHQAASHIVVRMKLIRPTAKLLVYADHPDDGQLLCTISGGDMEEAGEWTTVTKALDYPIAGEHDIYLVAQGTNRIQLMYLNWFQFQANNTVFADMTNNGGGLTTSMQPSSASISALTDDDVLTDITATAAVDGSSWVQYKSAWPFRLQGYSIFSGLSGADPTGWTLQGSTTGHLQWDDLDRRTDVSFSARGQKMQFPVNVDRDYTYYRLVLDLPDGGQQAVSLSEWQLFGQGLDLRDIASDGGTPSQGLEALCDHDASTAGQMDAPAEFILQTNSSYLLTGYALTVENAAGGPNGWTLYGSDNGRTWTAITQQAGQLFPYDGSTAVYALEGVPPYQHFKFTFEAREGAPVRLGEIQLLGKLDFGTFYLDLTHFYGFVNDEEARMVPLLDKNGYSYADLPVQPAAFHLDMPFPTRVLAYSIVSGNDAELDPKEVTLTGTQADGTESSLSKRTLKFPTRGARSTNSISSSKLFTSLDLNILSTTGGGPEARLAELEIYGTAIAEAGTPSLILPDEVSSSAQPASATEGVEKLNDQNRTTQYRAAFDGPQSIIFSYNEPQRINEYALTAARDDEKCDPRSWILEGSLDGETWNLLSRITNQAFSLRYATQFYGAHVQSTNSYKYYRLTVTEVNGGNQLQIGQLQLFRFGTDVGIAPTQADDELKLSVRHGLLSIVAPHTAELTIHDMQGRLVARSTLKAGYGTYAMSVLRNGLYVVTLTSGERKVTRMVKR